MGNASDPIRLDRLLLSLSGTLSDSPGHVMLCAENGLLLASRGGLGADHGRDAAAQRLYCFTATGSWRSRRSACRRAVTISLW